MGAKIIYKWDADGDCFVMYPGMGGNVDEAVRRLEKLGAIIVDKCYNKDLTQKEKKVRKHKAETE